eukprot:gene3797-4322_t
MSKKKQSTLFNSNFTRKVLHRGEMTSVAEQAFVEESETRAKCQFCEKKFKTSGGLAGHLHWCQKKESSLKQLVASTSSTMPLEIHTLGELIYNEVIRSRKDLIEEIKEGLETLGFFKAIESYPERFKELFIARNERFESKDLQDLLEYDAVKDFAEEQARDWFSSLVADSDDPLQNDDPAYNIAEALLSFTTSW